MTTPGIHLVQHEAAHEDAGGIPARRFGVPEEINEGVEVLLTATATSPAPRRLAEGQEALPSSGKVDFP